MATGRTDEGQEEAGRAAEHAERGPGGKPIDRGTGIRADAVRKSCPLKTAPRAPWMYGRGGGRLGPAQPCPVGSCGWPAGIASVGPSPASPAGTGRPPPRVGRCGPPPTAVLPSWSLLGGAAGRRGCCSEGPRCDGRRRHSNTPDRKTNQESTHKCKEYGIPWTAHLGAVPGGVARKYPRLDVDLGGRRASSPPLLAHPPPAPVLLGRRRRPTSSSPPPLPSSPPRHVTIASFCFTTPGDWSPSPPAGRLRPPSLSAATVAAAMAPPAFATPPAVAPHLL